MPNSMSVPLDLTALKTAPVEESVWPKSPATPNEKVGVAATDARGARPDRISPKTDTATSTAKTLGKIRFGAALRRDLNVCTSKPWAGGHRGRQS